MARADAVQSSPLHRLQVGDRIVEYRLVELKAGRKLRVRVGPNGVEVVQPETRTGEDVSSFLAANGQWIVDQLDRAERMRSVRLNKDLTIGEILYLGERTRVRIESSQSRAKGNIVRLIDGEVVISRGPNSRTPAVRSLELWLRREARREIEKHLGIITHRLGERPERVYVMEQRTKWGNCSVRRNLSFNWRIVAAPDFVIRYLVTHEAVHLVIPDHSARFWLTVQSLCRETERAKQWLCRYQSQMQVDLLSALETSELPSYG